MEALAYLLYSLVFGFFIGLIGGIVKGTSPKYLIQTLEETEADFIKICWNVFYSYLGIIFSILLMLFTFSIPFVLIPFVIGCYYFYLFVLSLVLVFRFYSNIEMREISKPLIFSLIYSSNCELHNSFCLYCNSFLSNKKKKTKRTT